MSDYDFTPTEEAPSAWYNITIRARRLVDVLSDERLARERGTLGLWLRRHGFIDVEIDVTEGEPGPE